MITKTCTLIQPQQWEALAVDAKSGLWLALRQLMKMGQPASWLHPL